MDDLSARGRVAGTGAQAGIDRAHEEQAGDARDRPEDERFAEDLGDGYGGSRVLRPAQCEPAGDSLRRPEQVVVGADRLRCEFTEYAARPEPHIVQGGEWLFCGKHASSLRNPRE